MFCVKGETASGRLEKEISVNLINEKDLYNCFEYGIVNILINYNMDFEYLFSESLMLDLSQEALDDYFCVNSRNFFFHSNIFDLSERYFGISFQEITINSSTHLLEYIERELVYERIILVKMDLFYDNSRPDYYRKVHSCNHCRIVTGMIGEDVVLYNWDKRYLMSWQDFENGVLEIITHTDGKICEHWDRGLDLELQRKTVEMNKSINWIKKLELWRDSFEQVDFGEIFQKDSDICDEPIFMDVRTLIRSRERYRLYLKSLLSVTEGDSYHVIYECLVNVVSKYRLMKLLLLKEESYYLKNKRVDRTVEIRKKLKRYLNEAICLEIHIFTEMDILSGFKQEKILSNDI